ncbi:threonine-phosphate decarboxylase CobD [Methylovirgula sp. 4M-Z18]|uniref:threonine-phosphate decarboxylase CobD n=1 Tax=Methylovirgula sp. 4M-Z18 TaxID=2293567 RepID=UPI000E2FA2D9|nr:threonine-phosphate decarboxylase CobD [Methylovirgula sp. 4M-Z18]RFB76397.1 threonine-phosphate decarboxylase [Methylovirgula sp. 4M-Z18]
MPSTIFHHGGNLKSAQALYPNAPQPWIDLSTGINPIAYPIPTIAPEAWTRLPETAHVAALEAAAAQAYFVRDTEHVVAAPGTQALIQWLPRLFPARTVGICGFTYGEHEKTWAAAGARVTYVETVDALSGFDVAVIVNPNNPDGRLVSGDRLLHLARQMAAKNGLLVVDEAFMDLVDPAFHLSAHMPVASTIILRSLGKTYGLAGLRLGFAIAPTELARIIRDALGPWAVSGPAIDIAQRALGDAAWREATRSRLRQECGRLDRMLQNAGFSTPFGTLLFRTAEHAHARDWLHSLAQTGILTRPFTARPHWLRFGLPAGEAAWWRLEEALRKGPKVPN